jgi:hypothetical protein
MGSYRRGLGEEENELKMSQIEYQLCELGVFRTVGAAGKQWKRSGNSRKQSRTRPVDQQAGMSRPEELHVNDLFFPIRQGASCETLHYRLIPAALDRSLGQAQAAT